MEIQIQQIPETTLLELKICLNGSQFRQGWTPFDSYTVEAYKCRDIGIKSGFE